MVITIIAKMAKSRRILTTLLLCLLLHEARSAPFTKDFHAQSNAAFNTFVQGMVRKFVSGMTNAHSKSDNTRSNLVESSNRESRASSNNLFDILGGGGGLNLFRLQPRSNSAASEIPLTEEDDAWLNFEDEPSSNSRSPSESRSNPTLNLFGSLGGQNGANLFNLQSLFRNLGGQESRSLFSPQTLFGGEGGLFGNQGLLGTVFRSQGGGLFGRQGGSGSTRPELNQEDDAWLNFEDDETSAPAPSTRRTNSQSNILGIFTRVLTRNLFPQLNSRSNSNSGGGNTQLNEEDDAWLNFEDDVEDSFPSPIQTSTSVQDNSIQGRSLLRSFPVARTPSEEITRRARTPSANARISPEDDAWLNFHDYDYEYYDYPLESRNEPVQATISGSGVNIISRNKEIEKAKAEYDGIGVIAPFANVQLRGRSSQVNVEAPFTAVNTNSQSSVSVKAPATSVDVVRDSSVKVNAPLTSVDVSPKKSININTPASSVNVQHSGSVRVDAPLSSIDIVNPTKSVRVNAPLTSVDTNPGLVRVNAPLSSVSVTPKKSVTVNAPFTTVNVQRPKEVDVRLPLSSVNVKPHREVDVRLPLTSVNVKPKKEVNVQVPFTSVNVKPKESVRVRVPLVSVDTGRNSYDVKAPFTSVSRDPIKGLKINVPFFDLDFSSGKLSINIGR